jgi:membrane associated rhomboid family serine protease
MTGYKTVRFFDKGNPLWVLLVVNTLLFACLQFLLIAYVLGNQSAEEFVQDILHYLLVPADMKVLLYRPWTVFTHMIVHQSIWQLIGNLLFLWSFGFLLQDLTGNRHLIPLYVYGGFLAILFFLSSVYLIPRFSAQTSVYFYGGAAASIMAIATGVTTLAPKYRIFPMINGGIPLWVLTAIYLLIDFAGLASSSFPTYFAHLGGALAGFLYVLALKKGKDAGAWMHRFSSLLEAGMLALGKKQTDNAVKRQVFYQTGDTKPYKKIAERAEKRIDALLDKIHSSGYDSLTNEEKEYLKKASGSDNPI